MAGLYAGITFNADGSTSTSTSSGNAAGPVGGPSLPSTTTTTATASSADTADAQRQREAALRDAEAYAAQQADHAAKEAAENTRKAALGFQPVVRKRAAPSKARPGATTVGAAAGHAPSGVLSGATISAAPSLYGAPSGDASTSSAFISAPPMELDSAASSSNTANKNAGRTLNAPPSMTLDENDDVNGFRATNAGQKAVNKQSKAKKNKRKHNNKREEDPLLAWDAEYDPSRPTDYNEYKAHAKAARAERRAQMLRDRRKKAYQEAGKAGSGSGSDDYTDEDSEDSDDERRKRIAKANSRFFAPPTSYGEDVVPPDSSRMDEDENGTERRPIALEEEEESKEPVPCTTAEDSDWAAWSAAPAVVPDDPFARRMALSQPHDQQHSVQAPQPPARQPSPLPAPLSYRAELSPYSNQGQGMSPPVPPPSFVGQGGQQIPLPPHMMPPLSSSRSPLGSASPANASSPYAAAAEPTSASSASGGPIPAVLQGLQVQDARAKTIEEAQARAKAIAAKLAGLGKLGGGPSQQADATNRQPSGSGSMSPHGMFVMPSADEPIPGLGGGPSNPPSTSSAPKEEVRPEDFAKTLMAKYGWTKGQGLGATSQGMVNPLALADSKGGSKQKKHHDQHSQQNPSTKTGPVGIATSKGRIVSDLKTEKEQEERRKYGEPTRVVCLSNMVGRGEVDDELVSDVSEEARKLGVLEHCFAHTLPPYVPEDEAVRVFITFSGLVGAWKAVKAFDGRFFGGRTVKAKFYEERALDIGALHL